MHISYIVPVALAGAVFVSGSAIGQNASPETAPNAIREAPAEIIETLPNAANAGIAANALLSPDLVGKEIVSAEGETVGEIEAIDGYQAIVSVGGFLGIGARQVAISRKQLSISGVGADAQISTTLTKDEVKALPEFTADASRGQTPSGGMDRNATPNVPESSSGNSNSSDGESSSRGSGGGAN